MNSAGGAGVRLLMHVDDDPDEAYLLQRALQKNGISDWEYLYFANGEEAIEYLKRAAEGEERRPDLLALDIRMPRISGMEILEWVSANVPELPSVMLSSSALLRDRLRARDLGSKGYFEKSATFSDLIEFLCNWETSHVYASRAAA